MVSKFQRLKQHIDKGSFLIALYSGLSVFLFVRGRAALYHSYSEMKIPVWFVFTFDDAHKIGAVLAMLASIMIYFSTRWFYSGVTAGAMSASLANAFIFFGIPAFLLFQRPYLVEAQSMGVFVAAGAVASTSTYWHVLLRPRQDHLAGLSSSGLRLRHAKYLEFVRLLSYTATILITGVWAITWAYWWKEIPELRSKPGVELLAEGTLYNFLVLAGVYFGVIHQFMKQLSQIEERIRDHASENQKSNQKRLQDFKSVSYCGGRWSAPKAEDTRYEHDGWIPCR